MAVRHFKLEVRYYRENPTFRLLVNVSIALAVGPFGALIFMNLLHHSGIAPFTGRWSDFIPPFWVLAYLLAYAAAILVQIFIGRRRNRDFTVVNIAVAFIVAFPVALPVFFLLFSLLANFLSRLFGQT